MDDDARTATERPARSHFGAPISRRAFLGTSAVFGGLFLVACTTEPPPPLPTDGHSGHPVPLQSGFLTPHEAETVDAITARIFPGDPDDPGAREANVLNYIDRKLASFQGFAAPAFLSGPFVDIVPVGAAASAAALTVPEDQLYRYGYQSGILPEDLYRNGIAALDRFTVAEFGAPFGELDEADQDAALDVLDQVQQRSERAAQGGGSAPGGGGGQGTGGQGNGGQGSGGGGGSSSSPTPQMQAATEIFGDLDPGEFFSTVRADAIEGMFSDPMHGGNQDLVGWILVGYPGAQRAYSPEEMLRGTIRVPQAMDHLPSMNPDRRGDLPLSILQQPLSGVREG